MTHKANPIDSVDFLMYPIVNLLDLHNRGCKPKQPAAKHGQLHRPCKGRPFLEDWHSHHKQKKNNNDNTIR